MDCTASTLPVLWVTPLCSGAHGVFLVCSGVLSGAGFLVCFVWRVHNSGEVAAARGNTVGPSCVPACNHSKATRRGLRGCVHSLR